MVNAIPNDQHYKHFNVVKHSESENFTKSLKINLSQKILQCNLNFLNQTKAKITHNIATESKENL